jgi:4-hydroxy-tetrahydrodipicolinate reductase
MERRRYRVAQWGTGHTGLRSLQDVLEHPRYDLVGAYVYAAEKEGRDAGELCGLAPAGVTATRNIDDIIAAKPDCVLYMPLLDHDSVDDMCRLLESGINIVTTATYYHHPPTMDPQVRARLEKACQDGGASLYDTGGAPGYINEIVPLALSMMERRLERYSVMQYADLSQRNSPDFLARRFGMDPATLDLSTGAQDTRRADGAALRQTADAMSIELDDVVASAAVAVARTTTKIGVATIEAGTVGAWRKDMVGIRDGKPVLSFTRNMYVTKDLDPAWEMLDNCWHVVIEGDAPLDVTIKFPPPEIYHPISAGYNSHVPVNSVPAVVEAAPGIRVTADLSLFPLFG